MAFSFNWSPLTADAGFYTRAQELLTTALNKSPKPPIIVDDILVNELNLGHVPPELEILEIGDLAEDRFRGIFKMSYMGDAFLTLKTRVQANPLNTYLSTRPSFGSPQPLAAATGLTIPLQITLSDIKLSAFIILVFSRQKGLTLVFRNDPLESLKVSSTFDSIPFVRDYLQKEIEGQLRVLLMDDLPAIIHRLSLRLWVPEYKAREDQELGLNDTTNQEPVVNPFASPPHDPVDSSGNPLNPSDIASLSLESGIETQSLFSQKNLIRLATLTNSHRTLSLFTPTIRDVVFRAWAGPTERGEVTGLQAPAMTPALSRSQSYTGSAGSIYTFSDTASHGRPALHSFGSASNGLSMGSSRHAKVHGARKRKNRVVNLRQKPSGESELFSEEGSTITDSESVLESTSSAPPAFLGPVATPVGHREHELEPRTPPMSPNAPMRSGQSIDGSPLVAFELGLQQQRRSPRKRQRENFEKTEDGRQSPLEIRTPNSTLRARRTLSHHEQIDPDATPHASMYLPERNTTPHAQHLGTTTADIPEKSTSGPSSITSSRPPLPNFLQFITDPTKGGTIMEQAWMVKMAGEIARRYEEDRRKGSFGPIDVDAPPAYAR